MGFRTDGSPHECGVKNEKGICRYLNENEPNDRLKFKELCNVSADSKMSFKHKGGTTSVSDMDIYANGVLKDGSSIKNHKTGTYDHTNSSAAMNLLPKEINDELKQKLDNIQEKYFKCGPEEKKVCRKELSEQINSCIDKISSDTIKKLLNYIDNRNPRIVIINNCETQCLKVYKSDQFKELSEYPKPESECEYLLRKKRNAKNSRSIFRKTSDGKEIDTNLRLRITLNNGISALLGLSNSNNNSVLSIKIQQDNVNKLLSSIEPYSSCSYVSN